MKYLTKTDYMIISLERINFINEKYVKQNLIFTLFLILSLTACKQENKKTAVNLQANATGSCSAGNEEVNNSLFTVDGMSIEEKDLPADIRNYVYKNNNDSYKKNEMVLKELALRIYLSKQQNKLKDPKKTPSIAELLKLPKATEKEAQAFFDQNKNRMPPNSNFGKMKGQIIQYLNGQKSMDASKIKMAELESKGLFTYLVKAPVAPKINIEISNFPTMGNKNSKINIIEISDYLCGHCQHAHTAVKKILEKYKDKISFTQINFSLRPTGLSGTYVRGAYCASIKSDESFWKFHHAAFEKTSVPHDHSSKGHTHNDDDGNSKDSLKKVISVAKTIGLNVKEFEKCLTGNASKSYVQKTNRYLSGNGINSTPVFIINNRNIEQGINGLEKAIKSEL